MAVTYTITGGLTHLSGNPIQIVLTASATRENHKLLIRVTCKNTLGVELFGSPFPEEFIPGSDLTAKADISGLVNYPADYGFTFPIGGAVNPHDILVVKATFEVGESWTDSNGDYQEEYTPAAETLTILKGKLRKHELAILNEAGKSFASEYIEGGKFLTHMPDYQKVSPTQICMLWYQGRWSEDHAFYINLSIKTDKGRTISKSEPHTYYRMTSLIELEFSRYHLNFWDDFQWGEKHLEYDFWLSDNADGTGEVSEHRHYIIDYTYYEQSVNVYAVNPLSGTDMHWFTGHSEQGLNSESETAVRPVPVGAGTQKPSIITTSSSGKRTWQINVGYKELKAQMLALTDLIFSKDIWIVDTDTNTLIPVKIEAGDFALYKSIEPLQEITLKFYEAHND